MIPSWIVPVGAVVGAAIIAGGLIQTGRVYERSKCDAARLSLELNRANEANAEKDRQIAAITGIQRRDAERAATAEQRARELEDAKINETPANPTVCFDAGAADRVRKTK